MIGFLVGLVVALLAALGVYYYMFMPAQDVTAEPRGASTQVQINTNKIPAGAMMEDGTIGE